MTDLLFLAQRIPYPPNKGDKIRSYHILRHLCGAHRVHLGCFVDDPDDWEYAEPLRAMCADAHFSALDPRWAKIRSLSGLLTGAALSLPYYRDAGLAAWVHRVIGDVRPDIVFVFSSTMAQYVLAADPRPRRFIMDFVDVDSDKWRQYAETRPFHSRWIYGRESRRLLDFERRVARAADASTFVSAAEAESFRALAGEGVGNVVGIGNGIDTDYFDPAVDHPRPFGDGGPVFVFTGAMDYWPNADAVTWFAREIFPRIRAKAPEAAFYIVGGKPDPVVRELAGLEGVTVTGRVPDVRPYLAHADVAVAPMRIARGVQNKVLEAMAMAKPVVTTRQGLEGIDATPGEELLVADDSEAIAAAALAAARDGAARELGAAARRRILADFGWPAKLARFDELLGD